MDSGTQRQGHRACQTSKVRATRIRASTAGKRSAIVKLAAKILGNPLLGGAATLQLLDRPTDASPLPFV